MAEITDQLMFLNGASKDMIASGDAETAINTVLAKVLDYFSAARAYIFEMNEAGTLFSNTYELCADGVEPQIDKLQNMPRRAADYWFSYFDGHDYLCVDVDSIGEGREAERQVLAAQNISALIAVPIKKNGKTAGFIGVDDPTRNVTHTDRLAALGTYMAVLTARRDMTAKARRDGEMMKHLMDDTPGGFARKQIMPDGSLVTLYVNEGLCRILGTTREEYMERCGAGTMWGVHPDDAEAVGKALKRVFAGETSSGLRYRRQRKDGGWVWFLVSCRMTVDESGDRFLNVYYKDLSEQEKQEMDLRESLPIMLSAMLESSSDLSFVKDGDLNYVCCSKAFADMVGLNGTAEIVGRTDYDIFDSELAEKYRADDRKLIDGGKSLVDYIEEIPGSDGHKHWSSTSKYLLRDADGGFIGIYGVGRDITESIVTEKALRVREQEIELAMAQMGKMILLYDIRTKTLTMPEQYARKHGIPAVMEDFPASFAPYRVLQQSDADAYAAFYRSILNGEDNCEAEASFICANGAAVREHAKAITIRDASGKPIKAVISVEEVKG